VSATPKKNAAGADQAPKATAVPKKTAKTASATTEAAPVKAAPKTKASAKPKADAGDKVAPELALPAVLTLVKIGKAKGNLTQDEIDGALGDIELTEHQVENVYSHFVESGIEIADIAVDVSADDAT